jgi:hypothetical protein
MQHLSLARLAVILLLLLAWGPGCSSSTPPPTPLTVEELPSALNKAFAKAKPETKTLTSQIVTWVQGQDYPKAFQALQSLGNSPGLTKEQQSVTSRATLTVNGLLQAAQAKGDPSAAKTLQNYRRDK